MVPLFAALVLFAPAPIDCPAGATSMGAAPPAGLHLWCEAGGQRHGPLIIWHETGRLAVEGAFAHGKKSGLWTYGYENGRRRAMGSFLEGVPDGVWTWWHDNGRLAEEGEYVAGYEQGTWRAWHPNGRLAEQGDWLAGGRHGWWREWDEQGREVQQTRYERDRVAEVRHPEAVVEVEQRRPRESYSGYRVYDPFYWDRWWSFHLPLSVGNHYRPWPRHRSHRHRHRRPRLGVGAGASFQLFPPPRRR